LLSIFVDTYLYLTPLLLANISSWNLFFKLNSLNGRIKPSKNDKQTKVIVLKKQNYQNIIKYMLILQTYVFLNIYFYKGESISFWWDHLNINNFNIYIIYMLMIFSFVLTTIIYYYSKSNINYNSDYFFSIINLILYLIIVFLVNNLFSFFFVIEVISIFFFYKFAISKVWQINKNTKIKENKTKNNKFLPKNHLNMLYFQYWSTFFSSVLIFISLINIFLFFGSNNFFMVNFYFLINNNISYISNIKNLLLIIIPLFVGFFIKIGLTPFHLYKLEVYKGLPYISIFFYTTFYFLSYILFFILLLTHYINSIVFYWSFLLFSLLLLGTLYICSLLFDVSYIKSFFGYSTIINTVNFLMLVLIIL